MGWMTKICGYIPGQDSRLVIFKAPRLVLGPTQPVIYCNVEVAREWSWPLAPSSVPRSRM